MKDFKLYAITGEQFHPGKDMLDVMEQAILGGVDIIQLRDKSGDIEAIRKKAVALRQLTAKYGVTYIVNDYIDIALEVDADGVHLGQGDVPLAEARRRMGKKIIGISTHAIEEAIQAERDGADYIGVGPIYPTKTKEDVVDPVTVSYVKEVASTIKIPFVAIGGIKLHNVDEVIKAGATRICAVSEIVGSDDIQRTCREFLSKLEKARAIHGIDH
ncbi:thiamine phosphate synthase [Paenibacillus camelliae]|uniref:thiamine phosphate synthase n=1 Tax=Paenibacillus camelliae TaxID=512410 RepID=UPI00203B88D6|nr:thiamine phosphate synthase [Paenibacillus camelliae]MCM3635838.1 thiamine phosphate synthase [Paenibacillus camelliae]